MALLVAVFRHPVVYWGLLPALGAAFLGTRLFEPLGWWALLVAYTLLGVIQAAMLTWALFWDVRDERD